MGFRTSCLAHDLGNGCNVTCLVFALGLRNVGWKFVGLNQLEVVNRVVSWGFNPTMGELNGFTQLNKNVGIGWHCPTITLLKCFYTMYDGIMIKR